MRTHPSAVAAALLPALALVPAGAARGQDQPFLTLTVHDPLPHIERALRSPSVERFLSTSFRNSPGQLGARPAQTAAGVVRLASPWIPERITVTMPGSAPRWIGALGQLGVLAEALEVIDGVPAAKARNIRERLASSLVGSLVRFRELQASFSCDFRSASMARRLFDQLVDAVTEAVPREELPGIEIVEEGDSCSLSATLIGGEDSWFGFLVESLEDDMSPADLALAMRELVVEATLNRTDARLELAFHARGAAPPPPARPRS